MNKCFVYFLFFKHALETVDISEKTLSEQLVTCIHQSKRAGYALEKWEFLKDYKYSVIFTCDDFSSTLKKAKEIIPLENTYENDYLYTSFVKPVAYSMDENYFLKFNLAYAAIHLSLIHISCLPPALS